MTGMFKKLFGGKAKEVEIELTVSHELKKLLADCQPVLSIRAGDEVIPARLVVKEVEEKMREVKCETIGEREHTVSAERKNIKSTSELIGEGRERLLKPPVNNPHESKNPQTEWHVNVH